MSSHDEFSSDEEDLFDEGSEVILGFSDVAFEEEDEEPTIEDTFLGGHPVWLHPNSRPNKEDLQCGNCQKNMALLLQAFAPFQNQPYDRVIYVFACKDWRQCSRKKGSIKAIRGVCKDPRKIAEIEEVQAKEAQELLDAKLKLEEKKKLHNDLTKDLFDASKPSADTKNPFSGNPFGKNPFGKFSNEATDAPFVNPLKQEPSSPFKKGDTREKSTKPSSEKPTYASVSQPKEEIGSIGQRKKEEDGEKFDLPLFPGYFVFTEVEKFKKVTVEPELEKYKDLIEKAEPGDTKKERSMSGSSAVLNPENSKIANMLNDKHFENFSGIVGHNPSQILRYSLGGTPLLYSGKDDVAKVFTSGKIPDPAYNPSSSRQYELQVMPKAIIDLEKDTYNLVADILGGMSWGTIIVATDVLDYMPQLDENHVGYVGEYCGVQWEEDV